MAAYVLTYATLVTALEFYLQRLDANFVSEIPLFIMLGQRRVARELKILGNKVFIEGSLAVGAVFLAKPADWLNSSDFYIGSNVPPAVGFHTWAPLKQRSYGYCIQYWPDATQTTQPKYIADYTYNSWYVAPTPDLAYPYRFSYYQLPSLIAENQQTNWLTENAPDVLLYAALLETASYLQDDDRIPTWQKYYDLAKNSLSEEDMRRIYDAFSKRGG